MGRKKKKTGDRKINIHRSAVAPSDSSPELLPPGGARHRRGKNARANLTIDLAPTAARAASLTTHLGAKAPSKLRK